MGILLQEKRTWNFILDYDLRYYYYYNFLGKKNNRVLKEMELDDLDGLLFNLGYNATS